MTRLDIHVQSLDTVDVLRLGGDLDLTNADGLESALGETSAGAVVLDLGALAFVDSAGIRAIDSAHGRLGLVNRRVLIVVPVGSRAAWTFRIAGFAEEHTFESVEAALDSLEA